MINPPRQFRLPSPPPQYSGGWMSSFIEQVERALGRLVEQPGQSHITPFVIGVDPDPTSSAVLRVGGGLLAGGIIESQDSLGVLRRDTHARAWQIYSQVGGFSVYDVVNARDAFTVAAGGQAQFVQGPLIVGTDPGGASLVRSGGGGRFAGPLTEAGWIHLNNAAATGEGAGDGRAALAFGASDNVEAWYVGAFTNDTRANTTLSVFSWQLGQFVQHWKVTGQIDFPIGPVVIGTDPGGSELLRVGGLLRVTAPTTNGVVVSSVFANAFALTVQANQDNNAAASLFQNAYAVYNSAGAATLKWVTTHGSFGSRGIWFDFAGGGSGMPGSGGIGFYADNAAATANSTFTPTLRMVVGNDGKVAIVTGPLVVGTDPGGSALLRVGGNGNFGTSGKVFFGGASTDFALRAKAGSPAALEVVAGDESVYAAFRASTIYATAGVSIGAFNDNHLFLLSQNSAYGWRIDTHDLGAGDVPLRVYRRTASVDTLALQIKNADGTVIIGTDPGSSDLLRVSGPVGISTSGTFVGTNRKALNLRGNRSSGGQMTFEDANASPGATWEVGIGAGNAADEFNWYNQTAGALRMSLKAGGALVLGTDPGGSEILRVGGAVRLNGTLIWQTDATYDIGASGATRPKNGWFSGTVTANAFSGDGSALTGLPSPAGMVKRLNSQRVTGITNTAKLTYTLPGGTLAADGDALRFVIRHHGLNVANTLVKFGATTLISQPTSADNFEINIILRRTGATTQIAYAQAVRYGTGGAVFSRTTPAETLSGNITITVESDSVSSTTDVDHWSVEFIPV